MVWHFSNKMVRLVGNNTTLRRIITLAKKEIMKKNMIRKRNLGYAKIDIVCFSCSGVCVLPLNSTFVPLYQHLY